MGEVEQHGLRPHRVRPGDGFRDVSKLGGVSPDKDEVEASTRELKGYGPADAGSRAGDYSPRAVLTAEVLRRPQAECNVGDQAEAESANMEGA
jgi:hypothetical protein